MIKKNVSLVALILSLAGLGGAPAAVRAENPYINVPEMQRLTREAQILWWRSLTPRQQQLERALEAQIARHRALTGQSHIPATRMNLDILMRNLGAGRHDADFLWKRLQYHARVGTELDRVDRFLDYANRNPNWYLPPHMR